MNKLNKAIILSAKIHSGKKGRNNEPAVLHPIRVMNQMKSKKGKIVGVLHDVVETEKISITITRPVQGWSRLNTPIMSRDTIGSSSCRLVPLRVVIEDD